MQIIETTFVDVTDLVSSILSSQREACVYCVGHEHAAIVGRNAGANLQEISKRGVRLIQISHEGGTIITSPGDVQIGIFTEGYVGHSYRDRIIDNIVKLVRDNGYNAIVANNDILVNGRKVVGFGSRMYGKILYTAIQVSIDIDVELIQSICTKQMTKIPDGLKNYGVETQDILDILFKVFDSVDIAKS